jgi:NTP pyrophosphatase (non-canonical NTP hydrolase)
MKKLLNKEFDKPLLQRTIYCVESELNFARTKFPSNEHLLAALVEEVGELSQALIDQHRGKQKAEDVFAEAIQVAAMAIRIAEEGSKEFKYKYNYNCYKNFNVNKLEEK